MALPLVLAGAQAVGSLYSIANGIGQGIKAKRMAKNNQRPDYVMPTEVLTNQQIAKNRAAQGLPEEQYNQATRNISRNQGFALSALQDRRSALSGISTLMQRTNDASLNLDVADAKQRVANEQQLMRQNQNVASYRDKEWDWNKRQKFQENAAAIRALAGASRQNIAGGVQGLLGAGTTATQAGLFDKKPLIPETPRMWDIPGVN